MNVDFNIFDREEREKFMTILKVYDYVDAVNIMYQDLRREVKHGEHDFVKVQSVFDRFVEIVNDYGLEVD